MARKRMIDPSIWDDENVGQLEPGAFKLFIALISNADDEGRLEVNAARMRGIAFRHDYVTTTAQVQEWLDSIPVVLRSVQFYQHAGRTYCQLTNWRQYQSINKPNPSKLPPPLREDYGNTTVAVTPKGREGKGIEVKGKEGSESASDDASSPSSHPIQKHPIAVLWRDLYLNGGMIRPISTCQKSWLQLQELIKHPLAREALGSKEQTEAAFEYVREKRCKNGNRMTLNYALACILGMLNDKLEKRNAE